MKALTVQQPWAWAIINAGKDTENRTAYWNHTGPLAIHAGARLSERGCELLPDILAGLLSDYVATDLTYGAIIGTVDHTGSHVAEPGCCDSPWAEQSYTEHGGRVRRRIVHMQIANPRALLDPIPAKGRLGLWTLPDYIANDIADQLAAIP